MLLTLSKRKVGLNYLFYVNEDFLKQHFLATADVRYFFRLSLNVGGGVFYELAVRGEKQDQKRESGSL